MIDLKQINVPVFLIYAGIIHAIGLALLMPMLVTLPGPGTAIAPKAASFDVEIAPAEADSELTSALPASPQSSKKDAAVKAVPDTAVPQAISRPKDGASGDVANVSPETQPEGKQDPISAEEKPAEAAPLTKDKAKADTLKPAKPVKKPVAQRGKPAKPAVHRSARKKEPKIAPFNGALSGLFTPGAPAKRR